jgi:sulfite exporter TauE/SafE
MCGPIALALPLDRTSKLSATFGALLYNGARIMGYASMGLLLGKLGQTLAIIELSKWVSILTGVFIIGYILYRYTGLLNRLRRKGSLAGFAKLNKLIHDQFGRSSYEGSFFIGLLNAFLPCGFVYVALAASLNTSSPLEGATYMSLFGLGTAPLMLSANLAGAKLRSKLLSPRLLPYILGLFAVLFILRGLALDIPFISPAIDATRGFLHACLP